MSDLKPAVCRIVLYTLSASDVEQINRRRTTSGDIAAGIREGSWPVGAQAHIGPMVEVGQQFPMLIVVVWSDTTVNGRVFLDGSDEFWARNVVLSQNPPSPGCWHWPPRS